MTLRVLLGPLVLFIVACCPCPAPGSAEAEAADAANSAAYHVAKGWLGPLAGDAPPPAGSSKDPCCQEPEGPAVEPAALASPEATCVSYTGKDPCVECATAWCCAQTVSCFAGGATACPCNLAKRTPGIQWPASVACDTEDDVFHAALSCLSAHCAACLETPS